MKRAAAAIQGGGGLVHAFGVTRELGAFLLADKQVMHAIGRSIVKRPLQPDSEISFVYTLTVQEEYTAMALSPDSRYVAIATKPVDGKSAQHGRTSRKGARQRDSSPLRGAARESNVLITLDSLFDSTHNLHTAAATCQHTVLIISVASRRVVASLQAEMPTEEYVHLAFSGDGKHVLGCARGGTGTEPTVVTKPSSSDAGGGEAAGSGADEEGRAGQGRCVVFVWEWEEERHIGTLPLMQTPATVGFKPNDHTIVAVAPPLRMYRLNQGSLFTVLENGALRRHSALDTVGHVWISPAQVVFVTASGLVVLIADNQLKQELHIDEGQRPICLAAVPCLNKLGGTSKPIEGALALLVGCADGTVVTFRHGPSGHLNLDRTAQPSSAKGSDSVRGIHIGPEGDAALVLCDDICCLQLVDPKPKAGGTACPDEQKLYKTVLSYGHAGPVVSVSAAVSRPLFFSVGVDRTLRSYEVGTWCSMVLMEFGQDSVPSHVTAHPSGLHLLVGFRGAGRVIAYHVSWTGVVEWQKMDTPNLLDLKYSTGGAFFAVAKGNEVAIHSSYSLGQLGALCTHGSPILSIRWALDDATIATGASDGMLYVWKVQGLQRSFEQRLGIEPGERRVAVNSIALLDMGGPLSLLPTAQAPAGEVAARGPQRMGAQRSSIGSRRSFSQDKIQAAVVGSNGAVSIADHGEVTAIESLQQAVCCIQPLSTVRGGAVLGMTDGRVQLRRGAAFEVTTDTVAHASAVTDVIASPADRYVVSAGADGSIFVVEGPGARDPESTPHMVVFCETRDVLKSTELALYEAQIQRDRQEANHKIEKLKMEDELRGEMRILKGGYEDRLRNAEMRIVANTADHIMQLGLAKTTAADTVHGLEEQLERETSHLEAVYRHEVERHETTVAELERAKQDALARLEQAAEEIKRVELRAAEREKEHWTEVTRVKSELLARLQEFESTAVAEREFEEGEHSEQLQHIVAKSREHIGAAKEELSQQRLITLIAKKEVETTQRKRDKVEAELATKDGELAAHLESVEELRAQVKQLRKERAEADLVLGEREKRCIKLREGLQRLEATIGVLDFRIKELERNRAPLEAELESMKSHGVSLQEALAEESRARRLCEETNRMLAQQHKHQAAALKSAETRAIDSEAFIRSMYYQLYKMIVSDDRSWDGLRLLLDRHKEAAFRQGLREIGDAASKGEEDSSAVPDVDEVNAQAELTRQRDHAVVQRAKLERRLHQLSVGTGKAMAREHSQSAQLLHTNFDLQKQAKHMQKKLMLAEFELDKQRRKIASSPDPRQPPHAMALAAASPGWSRPPSTPGGSRPLMSASTRPLTASASVGQMSMRSLARLVGADGGEAQNITAAEMQALENQRLRENLLFFASSPARMGCKGAGQMTSASMPLPPV